MLLVGIWWQENKNKLAEWKAFIDTMGLKSACLKDNFCSAALQTTKMQGKATKCHMLPRMIREIKVSSNWFGCVLVISFYITKVLWLCWYLRVQAPDHNNT